MKENPFWFEDIIKDAEQHYNQPAESSFISHSSHHHRKQQRAKRTHHRQRAQPASETLSVIHFDGDDTGRIEEIEEKMLAKRSAEYPVVEEEYPVNEVFSPGEVVGNIFNANDSLSEFAARNGERMRNFLFLQLNSNLSRKLFLFSNTRIRLVRSRRRLR